MAVKKPVHNRLHWFQADDFQMNVCAVDGCGARPAGSIHYQDGDLTRLREQGKYVDWKERSGRE
jgi:hypothetical protein